MNEPRTIPSVLAAFAALAVTLPAQVDEAASRDRPALDVDDVVQECCDILLEMQEGEGHREWPYEGVYRTTEGNRRRVIPIGYRVGGTAIACLALIEAPGYADHEDRREAVERGSEFVLEALDEPLMAPSTADRYDVRGWGHIYALALFVRLEETGLTPVRFREPLGPAIERLIDTLEKTAIEDRGGWAYAGRRAPSPFMTAPALQALFAAAGRGYDVDPKVVDEALAALVRSRTASGGIGYSVPDRPRTESEEDLGMMHKLPGSVARMSAVESTLLLAGRSDLGRVRAAIDAFFEHWIQLERRRQKDGTHIAPYGVAPYYFIYGHYYVAQAIELLPDEDARAQYRERFLATMAKVREKDGGWNGRVFPRSRNYGTAMGMMAISMKDLPRPANWPPVQGKSKR